MVQIGSPKWLKAVDSYNTIPRFGFATSNGKIYSAEVYYPKSKTLYNTSFSTTDRNVTPLAPADEILLLDFLLPSDKPLRWLKWYYGFGMYKFVLLERQLNSYTALKCVLAGYVEDNMLPNVKIIYCTLPTAEELKRLESFATLPEDKKEDEEYWPYTKLPKKDNYFAMGTDLYYLESVISENVFMGYPMRIPGTVAKMGGLGLLKPLTPAQKANLNIEEEKLPELEEQPKVVFTPKWYHYGQGRKEFVHVLNLNDYYYSDVAYANTYACDEGDTHSQHINGLKETSDTDCQQLILSVATRKGLKDIWLKQYINADSFKPKKVNIWQWKILAGDGTDLDIRSCKVATKKEAEEFEKAYITLNSTWIEAANRKAVEELNRGLLETIYGGDPYTINEDIFKNPEQYTLGSFKIHKKKKVVNFDATIEKVKDLNIQLKKQKHNE